MVPKTGFIRNWFNKQLMLYWARRIESLRDQNVELMLLFNKASPDQRFHYHSQVTKNKELITQLQNKMVGKG